MRSLLKVLKPGYMGKPESTVMIPDAPQPPPPASSAAKQAGAPGQEPVPVETVSPQEVYENALQRAKEEGEQLSERIMRLARMERETLLREAGEEAQALKEKAYQDAFTSVMEAKRREIDAALSGIRETLKELREEHRQYMAEYEKELKSFALDIASQIMCKRIEECDADMSELVMHALNSVKGAEWISVEISDKLPQLYAVLEKELETYRSARISVEVQAKDLPIDACVLQTPGGTVDASISEQLKNLNGYFSQID